MKPLDGLLVLDLSRVLAGPFCTMRLADMGARVIKVEAPEGDPTRRFGPPFVDGESPYFMSFNRGKEAITLDLKSDNGRAFVQRVLERADILVENFRPGVLARLGFDEATLEALAPRLIHLRITGYGPESPRKMDAAFDLAIQAESGLMAMSGEEGGDPVRAPISIADLSASVAGTEAVLAALYRREKTGRGARIDIALLDALVSLFGYQAQNTLMTGKSPERMGHRHPNLMPYQAFATADGHIVLAVGTDAQWRRLASLEEMPPGLDREDWRTNAGRVIDRLRLEPILAEAFRARSSSHWVERLRAVDVPFGVLRDLGSCLDDLRAQESTFLETYEHASLGPVEMTTGPIVFADLGRLVAEEAPPVMDEDRENLLAEFARDQTELAAWRAEIA